MTLGPKLDPFHFVVADFRYQLIHAALPQCEFLQLLHVGAECVLLEDPAQQVSVQIVQDFIRIQAKKRQMNIDCTSYAFFQVYLKVYAHTWMINPELDVEVVQCLLMYF